MNHHPGRKLGVPTRRDSITGLTKETTRQLVRRCGDEEGWDFRYDRDDYVFEKGNTRLRVRFFADVLINATLHRDILSGDRGRTVRAERVWDVLLGAECICPVFTSDEWAKGKDAPELEECPVCGTGEAA